MSFSSFCRCTCKRHLTQMCNFLAQRRRGCLEYKHTGFFAYCCNYAPHQEQPKEASAQCGSQFQGHGPSPRMRMQGRAAPRWAKGTAKISQWPTRQESERTDGKQDLKTKPLRPTRPCENPLKFYNHPPNRISNWETSVQTYQTLRDCCTIKALW